MSISILASLALPLALQAATLTQDQAASEPKPATFADLSIEEATAPRCGIAFAIVQGWQGAGNARGDAWPSMADIGAREFFLNAMVRLIDTHSLERSDVTRLARAEQTRFEAEGFTSLDAMMPACLALLEATSAKGG